MNRCNHPPGNPSPAVIASEALDAIGAAVRSSIAAHHVADVPVGMILSAGIDVGLPRPCVVEVKIPPCV